MVCFLEVLLPSSIAQALGVASILWPVCGNNSLTGSLMVYFVAKYGLSWMYIVPILIHPTALGIGGMVFLVMLKKWGEKAFLSLLLIWPLTHIDFFSDSGRFHIWNQIWHFFTRNVVRQWFGYGPGSLLAYGPNIIETIKIEDHQELFHIFAHNDLLQFLFEFGWVGILCLIPNRYVLSRMGTAGLVLVFACLFNYPFHNGLFCIIIGTDILWTMRKNYTPSSSRSPHC